MKNKYREGFRESVILGIGSSSIVCEAKSNFDKEFYAIKKISFNNFKGLLEGTRVQRIENNANTENWFSCSINSALDWRKSHQEW